MRKIRFRGKTHTTAEWVYGSLIIGLYGEPYILNYSSEGYNKYTVLPQTVGQYTGMDDNDINEIYEGDILKVKDFFDNEFECVVCFGNSYHHAFGLYAEDGCWHDFNNMVSMTIIGNIHDNPELFSAC